MKLFMNSLLHLPNKMEKEEKKNPNPNVVHLLISPTLNQRVSSPTLFLFLFFFKFLAFEYDTTNKLRFKSA